MNKHESTMLKKMRSRQTLLNHKMDRLTSDLCLMKIQIGHIDHDIMTLEQNDKLDSPHTHKDKNNNTLRKGDRVRILTGTAKAKKNSLGIFLDVKGDYANITVTDERTQRKTTVQRMTKNLLLLA